MTDDQTWRANVVAYEMRDYYEASRPLRWWEKRNPPGSWGCIADDLMLGLRNIVLDAERAYRAQASQHDQQQEGR